MASLSKAIIPKSDQMNADDLIGGPKTIEIVNVKVLDTSEQSVHVNYKGGEGKPWKPCKGMCRVMVAAWGDEGDDYTGRKITLFCNPKVKWGGAEAGGIQISHMSNLKDNKPLKLMLTISRGKRSPFTVSPIIETPKTVLTDDVFDGFCADMANAETMPELAKIGKRIRDGWFDDEGVKKLKEEYGKAQEIVRGLVAE